MKAFMIVEKFDHVGCLIFCHDLFSQRFCASGLLMYFILFHHNFRLTQGRGVCQASYMLFRMEIVTLENIYYI